VGPVVVVVDVGGDHLPGLVEGLELVAPDASLLQVSEPPVDERLVLGGPAPARLRLTALNQPPLAHRAQDPLAIHRSAETPAHPRGHDP
jgi:hypothetical protein